MRHYLSYRERDDPQVDMLVALALADDLGLLAHRLRIQVIHVLEHGADLALERELAAGAQVEAGRVDDGEEEARARALVELDDGHVERGRGREPRREEARERRALVVRRPRRHVRGREQQPEEGRLARALRAADLCAHAG
jgi:hypothetical protein